MKMAFVLEASRLPTVRKGSKEAKRLRRLTGDRILLQLGESQPVGEMILCSRRKMPVFPPKGLAAVF